MRKLKYGRIIVLGVIVVIAIMLISSYAGYLGKTNDWPTASDSDIDDDSIPNEVDPDMDDDGIPNEEDFTPTGPAPVFTYDEYKFAFRVDVQLDYVDDYLITDVSPTYSWDKLTFTEYLDGGMDDFLDGLSLFDFSDWVPTIPDLRISDITIQMKETGSSELATILYHAENLDRETIEISTSYYYFGPSDCTSYTLEILVYRHELGTIVDYYTTDFTYGSG